MGRSLLWAPGAQSSWCPSEEPPWNHLTVVWRGWVTVHWPATLRLFASCLQLSLCKEEEAKQRRGIPTSSPQVRAGCRERLLRWDLQTCLSPPVLGDVCFCSELPGHSPQAHLMITRETQAAESSWLWAFSGVDRGGVTTSPFPREETEAQPSYITCLRTPSSC